MATIHYFQPDIAVEYGVNAAILLENINFWIEKNEANEKHYHDGYYWTYNSIKGFGEMFPYMTQKAIRSALQKLIDGGLILAGNYNQSTYDRTLWYAITQKGKCICQKGQMDFPKKANGFAENGKPIPDNKPDNKPDKSIYNNTIYTDKPKKSLETRAKFTPPTVEQVAEYCQERHNSVDPEQFVDFYTMKGWKVGKEPMKDWKAAVRTWEKRRKETESKDEGWSWDDFR